MLKAHRIQNGILQLCEDQKRNQKICVFRLYLLLGITLDGWRYAKCKFKLIFLKANGCIDKSKENKRNNTAIDCKEI